MLVLELFVIFLSVLTAFLTYTEYRKSAISIRKFVTIIILEALVIFFAIMAIVFSTRH